GFSAPEEPARNGRGVARIWASSHRTPRRHHRWKLQYVLRIIRCLTERLPLMICPRWVVTKTQPIAVSDVLEYLEAELGLSEAVDEPIEIGGSTVETYRSMMLAYARYRGLRRLLLLVPVLTPRLSSYWLDFVTPVPPAISRPLIEGLRSESVCTKALAARLFPSIH